MRERQSKSSAKVKFVGDCIEANVLIAQAVSSGFCTQTLRSAAFALVMLWNSTAWTQPAPTPTQAESAAVTPPAYYYPSSCDQFLPPGTTHPQTNRVTILSYRLPLTGELEDVSVLRSSGDSNLDQAAVQCAKTIREPPLKVAGVSTEVSWVTGFFWNVPPRQSGFYSVSPAGTANICGPVYPPVAIRQNQEGTVLIRYHVGTDGNVKDVAIAHSSGFPWLDGAAVTCTEFFHYFPATQNGKPVEIDRVSQIAWKLH